MEDIRRAMPDVALYHRHYRRFSGETEEDFRETMDVVRRVGVRQRLYLPLLQAVGDASRFFCGSGAGGCGKGSGLTACLPWCRRSAGKGQGPGGKRGGGSRGGENAQDPEMVTDGWTIIPWCT